MQLKRLRILVFGTFSVFMGFFGNSMRIEDPCFDSIKTYACKFDFCDSVFSDSQKFYDHVNMMHVNKSNETWTCYWKDCRSNYSTKDVSSKKRHLRIHTGEKPYACKKCRQSFGHLETLKTHRCIKLELDSDYDDGESSYRCAFGDCSEAFGCIKRFYQHVNFVHARGRKWECLWGGCDEHYSTDKTDLKKRHLRRHTGEKPYTCSNCKKSYADPIRPDRHKCVKTQVNEKEFKCRLCSLSFEKKKSLTAHISTVHAKKRFSCPFWDCDKGITNQRSKLKRHLLTHLKKLEKSDKLFVWENYQAKNIEDLAQAIIDGYYPN